ncbi:MAG: HlyD family type I secretion periplasmic adaptor subunit [Gammaproteobacteria bacterium]|nr:HlyD family type I secretion periplasmic adaptor subunit [Gammaproteobacteria bacterium]MYH86598.1 HlyD family type I secretion periplasmic adaptor subunit [Gammaproteobacteria bacterium]
MNRVELLPAAQPKASSSIKTPVRVGLTIFTLVFGVFGGWAALAPIDGAAYAPGQVKVESQNKSVQHLEGGIISEILVGNGDLVEAGQPLINLDRTQPLAQLEVVRTQYMANLAREARLIAQREGADSIAWPESLDTADPATREEIDAQTYIFETRKTALEGNVDVLETRIGQLESRVVGMEAMRESKRVLAASFADELEDTRELLDLGFSDRIRFRELERNVANFSAEAEELTANIASTNVQIGETRLQIQQLEKDFNNEVAAEFAETRTNLNDLQERIIALEDVVERTVIRAPDGGYVTGMQIHTVGGVISPGMIIVDIVPEDDELVIEAQVSPIDIDRVALNQHANIRFSTFGSTVPTTFGEVTNLSADSFQDPNTGISYYVAEIKVTAEGMESLGGLVLMPGMPAEVFITTGARTFLQYLFKPFSNAVARSFRED